MTERPKLCWFCEWFSYHNSYNYSEYTQGDFCMSCHKNMWDFNANSTTQEEFAKILSTAGTCAHFNLTKEIIGN